MREVYVITDHKPFISIFTKRCGNCVTMNTVNPAKNSSIQGANPLETRDMDIRVDAIQGRTNIPECMPISQIQQAMMQDEHLQCLKNNIISGWPATKDQLHLDIRPYWSYKDDLAVKDGIVMKGRCTIIPKVLKQQALDQLHVNHMGIKKLKLLECESIYWVQINDDIKNYVKYCSTCLEFQQMLLMEKNIHHDISMRPWDVTGTDMFQLNNRIYICIVDYHSKFPVVQRMDGLSADSLIAAVKVIFVEYGIPCRIMSDAGSNVISEKFKNFCNSLNIEQAVSSSYHHESTRQVEACIKFIKCTIKKYTDTGGDIHMAILQIRTTSLGQGLPSPTMLLFNCPVRGIMPVMDRPPINIDNDDEHHQTLMHRQCKMTKAMIPQKSLCLLQLGQL